MREHEVAQQERRRPHLLPYKPQRSRHPVADREDLVRRPRPALGGRGRAAASALAPPARDAAGAALGLALAPAAAVTAAAAIIVIAVPSSAPRWREVGVPRHQVFLVEGAAAHVHLREDQPLGVGTHGSSIVVHF